MRKTADRNVGQRALRVICILLLLLLLVFILLAEVKRSTATVGRERAEVKTFAETDDLVGYVFRDEMTVSTNNNGPIEYLVEDGGIVLSGQELAKIYTGSKGGTEQREAAAPIYEEIARLEKALEQDMIAWQLSYADSYSSLMDAVSIGQWQTGLDAAAELSDTLEKRSVLKGDGEEVRVKLATLRAQADELVRYEDEPHIPTASETAYFSRSTDGYEALFGTDAVSDLTPEGLALLLSSGSTNNEHAVQNIGKLVSVGRFYLAVPVSAECAATYTAGADYRVRLGRGGVSTMTLTRVALSDSGEALLIFGAERCPAGMDLSRRQPLSVEREYVTGLSVPVSALFYEGEQAFVYVVSDGVAMKRRVNVLFKENGCCIVASDGGEGYLAAGENVLVMWRSVYEGKELNR